MSKQLVLFIHSLFPEDRGQQEIGEGIELVGVFDTKEQVKQAILQHHYANDETLKLNWNYFDEYSQVDVEDADEDEDEDDESENKLGFIVKTSK